MQMWNVFFIRMRCWGFLEGLIHFDALFLTMNARKRRWQADFSLFFSFSKTFYFFSNYLSCIMIMMRKRHWGQAFI